MDKGNEIVKTRRGWCPRTGEMAAVNGYINKTIMLSIDNVPTKVIDTTMIWHQPSKQTIGVFSARL